LILYPPTLDSEGGAVGGCKAFKYAMNGSGWKYSTRAAGSAPRLPETAVLIFRNRSSSRQITATLGTPRLQALHDIADFMVNGG